MINIKSVEEIEIMKQGGKILAEILKKLEKAVKPGITTWSLEEKARELIKQYPDTEPAFLGYHDYPAVLCTSVNEQVVHAKPSDRVLNEGDLLKIDMGIFYRGFNTDSAITLFITDWAIPKIEQQKEYLQKNKLIKITKECLDKGIEMAKSGNTIGDISYAIQNHAEKNGFSVIRDLVGHGIGKELHEAPEVPNFGKSSKGPILKTGMTIAIEPMLSAGSYEVVEDKKTLAWKTKDNSLSAHFEHTVAITKNGPLVLTE
ncbi:MAG: methionyl aminopeptidase [Parcubacteria group bacterium Gr01-1014_2]|nr:MAG: methionyl aminopeptidase [Parcubacteria group bacterium Gr01-1014_2]